MAERAFARRLIAAAQEPDPPFERGLIIGGWPPRGYRVEPAQMIVIGDPDNPPSGYFDFD